jgi:hypothetical protein
MTPIINARLADMPYLVRKTLTESTPQLYRLMFNLEHPDQIEGWEGDPRTCEQKDLDEWQADWQATNESNRP